MKDRKKDEVMERLMMNAFYLKVTSSYLLSSCEVENENSSNVKKRP